MQQESKRRPIVVGLVLSVAVVGAWVALRTVHNNGASIGRFGPSGGVGPQSGTGTNPPKLDSVSTARENAPDTQMTVSSDDGGTARQPSVAVPSPDSTQLLTSLWDFEPGWNGMSTDYQLQENSDVYQPRGFRPISLDFYGLEQAPDSRSEAYEFFINHVLHDAQGAASFYEGASYTTIYERTLRNDEVPAEDRLAAETILKQSNAILEPLVAELKSIVEVEYDSQLRSTAIKLFRRGEMPPAVVKPNGHMLNDYVAVGDWYCVLAFDPLLNPEASVLLRRIVDERTRRDSALGLVLD